MAVQPRRRSSQVVRREPDFEIDLTTFEGITAYAQFYVDRAANLAGMCMTDHLDDEGVVGDMHDVIGALGAVQTAFQLLADVLGKAPGRQGGQQSDGSKQGPLD